MLDVNINNNQPAPIILAIESSCDETAVAIYQNELLAHSLHSQIARHQLYGGVVPELASRDHLTHIIELVKQSLSDAKLTLADMDVFAYTQGPGLAGCLLVGATVAKSLAMSHNKPSLPIHHLEGHLLAPFLENNNFGDKKSSDNNFEDNILNPQPLLTLELKPEAQSQLQFPYLALLVSGGHTQFIAVMNVGEYQILGDTLDDALGEAFDKTAKMLGLPYPGGAEVSKKAEKGQAIFDLPTPMLHSHNLEMSFAGLKTAVLYLIQAQKEKAVAAGLIKSTEEDLPENISDDICASFVQAIVKVMSKKSKLALDIFCKMMEERTGAALSKIQMVITGGVGANLQLRKALSQIALQKNATLFYPAIQWCTDNAAMIALAAAFKLNTTRAEFDASLAIEVKPRWQLC